MKVEDQKLGGFERRLMAALEEVDAKTPAGDRAVSVTDVVAPRKMRRLVVPAAATVVALTGAATAVALLAGGATFQVGAEAVVPGQVVVAKGSGCGSGEAVRVSLDGAGVATATAASDGLFLAEVRIPDAATTGSHALEARCATADGEDLVQRITINVVESFPPMGPSLDAAGDAVPGSTARVKGSGCRPGEVALALDGVPSGTTTATGDGTFFGEITVPASIQPGEHEVSASCMDPDGRPLTQETTLSVVAAGSEPPATKG